MTLPILFLALIHAFSPAQTTSGDFRLAIADPPPITRLDEAIPVTVTLSNTGSENVDGTVQVELIDHWRVVGEAKRVVKLDAGASVELVYQCVPGKGTYAAHYPIHARARLQTAQGERMLHTVLVVEVPAEALVEDAPQEIPEIRFDAPGAYRLTLKDALPSFTLGTDPSPYVRPVGWAGNDAETGLSVTRQNVERGERRRAIGVHPPWRRGWGVAFLDYQVSLPDAEPILLTFGTAIRDHRPDTEPPSDGVLFEVQVRQQGEEGWQKLYSHFSDAKRWEDAQVDLSAFAGSRITLRLVTHPGPNQDTTCDQAYWSDPNLLAGVQPPRSVAPPMWDRLHQRAETLIRDAIVGERAPGAFSLSEGWAAALVPGSIGLIDGVVAVGDTSGLILFDGVRVEIDDRRVGDWRSGLLPVSAEQEEGILSLPIPDGARRYRLRVKAWSEDGGLRLTFSLEGIEQEDKDRPRITYLALGPVSEKVRRLYAGHGNVLQEPGKVRLRYGGFDLSTSFAGFDFANGISLVQGTDIPPDAVVVDPERGLATLEAHHELTLTLVPSRQGAFDAARIYRGIAKPEAAGGVPKLLGRMALDQWGGDYGRAADDLARAAAYGLTDSIFIKHVWQRWGYDYRLPDIYPPAGDISEFQRMVTVCKENGILFAPHDNYIDFYPDAPGFSYQHIIFNADGTPQKAWYNRGREAQSYRWLPHAFQPWMESNLAQIAAGVAPTGYFIDVFSAIGPMDYRDEEGNFYPKTETVRQWGAAFDDVREALGGAPTISEAGHDALVGHLDGAEADHKGWKPSPEQWSWSAPAVDGERIPWHDMVTHGKFVMMAGGLGNRYAGGGSQTMHGYGSDDYLTLTVLAGRSPMSDGPFNRRAVFTYWLLHDICAELASREFTAHSFLEDNIHRQRSEFGDDAWVVVNRSGEDWQWESTTLPEYGFVAQAGEARADIARRDGVITSYATSPEAIFVDARPPEHFGGLPLYVAILGIEPLGDRRFALLSRWVVQSPIDEPGQPFLHFSHPDAGDGEQIAFQGGFDIGPEQWQQIGIYDLRSEVVIPEDAPLGEYAIRFGIYQPKRGGRRLTIPGPQDATGRRRGGTLVVAAGDPLELSYQPEPPDEATERLNLARRLVDFGGIMTNGAFRLLRDERLVIPLPGSADFEVIFDLDILGYPRIERVEALDIHRQRMHDVEIHTQDALLHFTGERGVFAYHLVE